MSIFSRMGDIINANLNAMVDRAEDPEKITRLIIQEMEDTLVEVRSAAARAMADRKEIDRDLKALNHARDDWAAKAELAIEKGREDLARGALVAKSRAETEIALREKAMEAADEAIEKRNADLDKLQKKLEEAKAKHRALLMRQETAQGRIRVREALYDGKFDDAMSRYANVERKVEEMEAYADTIGPRGKTLAQQFADLEAEERVEMELAELRKRLGKKAAKGE